MIDKRLFKATMSSSYQFDFYRCLSPENTYGPAHRLLSL